MILSMDFGTSSLKLALVDRDLRVAESARAEYGYRTRNGNWVELEAGAVRGAMRKGVAAFAGRLNGVEAIAFDTFSPSPVLLDERGELLYPVITHLDRRGKAQSERIVREMGSAPFQAITGIQPFVGGASVTTFLWLMEHEPELAGKAFRFGHLTTYIYRLLSGRWATDPVNASQTGMYETVTGRGWSETICKAFGVPMEKLPDVLEAGAPGGRLTREAADFLGLREGIPVFLGTNDAAAAQVGAGNINSGDILNVSGSSEMISILSDKPAVCERYYLRHAATPGLWQVYATTASGFAVEWFRREFCRDLPEREFYRAELGEGIRLAMAGTPVRFSPYIAGDRQSLTPKTGSFTGLTLQARRRDLLAAILLGIHEPIIETLKLAGEFLDLNRRIVLTGGMVDDDFITLKRHLMPGFDFVPVRDCPLIGNARMALEHLS